MQKNKYQLRCAAGKYWLLDMEQDGEPYRPPLMLNESGAYIFRQYTAGNTADKIAEELATMYGGTAGRYADRCDAVYQTNGTTGDLVNDEYIIGGKQMPLPSAFDGQTGQRRAPCVFADGRRQIGQNVQKDI